MKPVQKTILIVAGLIAVSVFTIVAVAESGRRVPPPSQSQAERIEHGRYLVHNVGMCIDCHSPRDERGEFVDSKHLSGAPLGFAATVPMPWMPLAPRLAGLPAGYTEDDTVRFLMTGERPNNMPATLPPMPPFRMNDNDAKAIAAYLKSLPVNTD